ncbi:HNH endonuclease [Escherichia coli]|jgi:hypothetical protein|uniref:AP2 domain protein n=1 Tax=Hafnia alvei ATCC 51873 TaxID=1002364 RepID=G9Y3Q6_HAFAL|nr:HNH endonuclease [Hafnia alvei]EHM45250.1 AP2 domain protein [Hafnia alvei ATCC 51873]ELL2820897.1 HNH endonuclease [Escherichia coli]QQE43743.1 HNH endonuclease [Hafnia alvei]QQE43899.1 HNH endonuclease [Hafnia alvei]
MNNKLITSDEATHLLSYNPRTGSFVWNWRAGSSKAIKSWNGRFAGKLAGTINDDGYLVIGINRRIYPAHRLAWLIFYGEHPEGILDHINRVRTDNRIENLRKATHSQNMQNRKMQSNNKSGFRGVSWDERYGKWRARIKVSGKIISLGYHPTAEKASIAFEQARKIHHIT